MSDFNLTGFINYDTTGTVYNPGDHRIFKIDSSYLKHIDRKFMSGNRTITIPLSEIDDEFVSNLSNISLDTNIRLFFGIGSMFSAGCTEDSIQTHPIFTLQINYILTDSALELSSTPKATLHPNLGLQEKFKALNDRDIYSNFDTGSEPRNAIAAVDPALYQLCSETGLTYDVWELTLFCADRSEEMEFTAFSVNEKVSIMPGFSNMDSIFAKETFPRRSVEQNEDIDKITAPDSLYYLYNNDMSRLLALHDATKNGCLLLDATDDRAPYENVVNFAANAIGNDNRLLITTRDNAVLDQICAALDNVGLGEMYIRLTGDVQEDNRRIVSAFMRSIDFFNRESTRLSAPRIAEAYRSIERTRGDVSNFYAYVNGKIGNTGMTLYGVNGCILVLEKRFSDRKESIPEIAIANPEGWTPKELAAKLDKVRELERHIENVGLARNNPFWGSKLTSISAEDIDKLTTMLDKLSSDVAIVRDRGNILADVAKLPAPVDMKRVRNLSEPVRYLAGRPDCTYVNLDSDVWAQPALVSEEAKAAVVLQEEYNNLILQTADFVETPAESFSINEMTMWKDTLADDKVKLFDKDQRQAKKQMSTYFSKNWKKLKTSDKIGIIDKCIRIFTIRQSFDYGMDLIRRAVKGEFRGVSEDIRRVLDFADWYTAFGLSDFNDNEHVAAMRTKEYDTALLSSHLIEYDKAANEFRAGLREFLDTVQLVGFEIFLSYRFANILSQISVWRENIGKLSEIADYNRIVKSLDEAGLSGVTQVTAKWSKIENTLCESFLINYYRKIRDYRVAEVPEFIGVTTKEITRRVTAYASQEKSAPALNLDKTILSYVEKIKLAVRNSEFFKQYMAFHDLCENQEDLAEYTDNMLDKYGRVIRTCIPVFIAPTYAMVNIPHRSGNAFDCVLIPDGHRISPYSCLGAILRAKQMVVIGCNSSIADAPADSLMGILNAKRCYTRILRPYFINTRPGAELSSDDRNSDPFMGYVADVIEDMGLRAHKPCDPHSPIMLFVMPEEITSMKPLAAIIADGPEMNSGISAREQSIMLPEALERDNILVIRTSSGTWGERELRVLQSLKKR